MEIKWDNNNCVFMDEAWIDTPLQLLAFQGEGQNDG